MTNLEKWRKEVPDEDIIGLMVCGICLVARTDSSEDVGECYKRIKEWAESEVEE
ncbi:hypothetical protein LQZ18_04150 [Lachnospiraceae bacterium ZAX-1]